MRGRARLMAAAAVLVTATLVLAACGSGDNDKEPDADATNATGGEFTAWGCTPENPLIAGNTAEVCGGDVLDLLTAKLMDYNAETAEAEFDIAESIETGDNQNFTIKIKPGYKFHDGTEVTAKSFVDAWNYTAYGPNGQQGSYFMSVFAGFKDLQCGEDENCDKNKPKTDKMSGLAVVDDLTFTAKTEKPTSNLPTRLGYTAFAPQPDAFFADTSDGKQDFAKKPIGAGPYQADTIDTQNMVLTKFADYSGAVPGRADKITFRIYQDTQAPYADLVAGNLDVLNEISPDQLVGDQYQTDLGDRHQRKASMTIGTLEFSPSDDQLKDKPELRKAISMAIDRETINQQLFSGSRPPLEGWGSPALPGYTADACGETCTFDKDKAKQMFDKAGGYKGKFMVTTNPEGAGNKETMEAICNQLRQNLGMDCQVNFTTDFQSFLKGRKDASYSGMWRSGWQADYPSLENYLTPLYSKGASSNYTRYDNPKFEELLSKGDSAKSADEANKSYRQAEGELARDLPALPLNYKEMTIGWSTRVSNVNLTPLGVPDYKSISVTG